MKSSQSQVSRLESMYFGSKLWSGIGTYAWPHPWRREHISEPFCSHNKVWSNKLTCTFPEEADVQIMEMKQLLKSNVTATYLHLTRIRCCIDQVFVFFGVYCDLIFILLYFIVSDLLVPLSDLLYHIQFHFFKFCELIKWQVIFI